MTAHARRDRRRTGHRQEHARPAARRPVSQRVVRRGRRRASGIRACSKTSTPGATRSASPPTSAALYDANYRDAADNDRPGKVIFFEGARITLEAHIAEYPAEYHAELRNVLAIGDAWNPDRVIVLTSSTDTIEKHIRQRNRPHESAENMVRRFRLIDGEFRRLAPDYPNTVVIDRDGMEFHERAGLVAIIEAAGLPMFREIPYRAARPVQPDHGRGPIHNP